MNLDLTTIVDAICGGGTGSREMSERLRKLGLVAYVGGFHDSYGWHRDVLKNMSRADLMSVYDDVRKDREALVKRLDEAAAAQRNADRVDGFDRDDLGDSPDF